MTHIGKIGRLSQTRRDQLGQRLEDGVPGVEIIAWLNQQPDVQQVLADHFDGRPMTEQNLSDWRTSGHLEWQRREAARHTMEALADEAAELQDITTLHRTFDQFTLLLIAELHRLGLQLLAAETDPLKRWQQLCQINREFTRLRRLDLAAARQRMNEERNPTEIHRDLEASHGPRCAEDSSNTRPGHSADQKLPAAPSALEVGLRSKITPPTTPAPNATPVPAVARPTPPATPSRQQKSHSALFLPPIDLTVPAKLGLNIGKSSLIGVNQGEKLSHPSLPR
jgi:hypothetical protein